MPRLPGSKSASGGTRTSGWFWHSRRSGGLGAAARSRCSSPCSPTPIRSCPCSLSLPPRAPPAHCPHRAHAVVLRSIVATTARRAHLRRAPVRDPVSDCNPKRWRKSPRTVMRCTPRASCGSNHLGLCALQRGLFRGLHRLPGRETPGHSGSVLPNPRCCEPTRRYALTMEKVAEKAASSTSPCGRQVELRWGSDCVHVALGNPPR